MSFLYDYDCDELILHIPVKHSIILNVPRLIEYNYYVSYGMIFELFTMCDVI